MLCPVCAGELKSAERQGIELDYCSDCGGIWLDQGELTELIRRESLAVVTEGQRALSKARHNREFDVATHSWDIPRLITAH
jgi:Zn-finger nucleic acid-binding protein